MHRSTRDQAPSNLCVGIYGAGAIGTFVGTLLSAASVPVVLLGRRRLVKQRSSIVARGPGPRESRLSSHAIVTDDDEALAEVDVCLVCVKSKDTAAAGRSLRRVLRRPSTLVVSLQNGLHNPETLRRHLDQPVAAGVVGFNVRPDGEGCYQQTVPGPLCLEAGHPRAEQLADGLRRAGQPTSLRSDIGAVMRGKLLLNTNNGVCAATGLGIMELLRDADARWCFSQCIREGLRVFEVAGEPVARVGGPGPRLLSSILRLPNFIMRPLLALSSLDERAEASTTADLRRGRSTEIARLNGHISALGRAYDVPTPVNRAISTVVRKHEYVVERGGHPLWWGAARLRRHCELEQRTAALEPLEDIVDSQPITRDTAQVASSFLESFGTAAGERRGHPR